MTNSPTENEKRDTLKDKVIPPPEFQDTPEPTVEGKNVYWRLARMIANAGRIVAAGLSDTDDPKKSYRFAEIADIRDHFNRLAFRNGLLLDFGDDGSSTERPETRIRIEAGQTWAECTEKLRVININNPTDATDWLYATAVAYQITSTDDKYPNKARTAAIKELLKKRFDLATNEPDPDKENPAAMTTPRLFDEKQLVWLRKQLQRRGLEERAFCESLSNGNVHSFVDPRLNERDKANILQSLDVAGEKARRARHPQTTRPFEGADSEEAVVPESTHNPTVPQITLPQENMIDPSPLPLDPVNQSTITLQNGVNAEPVPQDDSFATFGSVPQDDSFANFEPAAQDNTFATDAPADTTKQASVPSSNANDKPILRPPSNGNGVPTKNQLDTVRSMLAEAGLTLEQAFLALNIECNIKDIDELTKSIVSTSKKDNWPGLIDLLKPLVAAAREKQEAVLRFNRQLIQARCSVSQLPSDVRDTILQNVGISNVEAITDPQTAVTIMIAAGEWYAKAK